MAQAARSHHGLLSFLDTDGKSHPVENTVAVVTVVIGVIAFVTAHFPHLHLVSSWVGLIGMISGAWGQLRSVTTGERFLLIIGLGAAGVGFYLGMAHGGLFGGVLG
ncbi:hypothetical protein VT50_0216235 [Streptomyces antioxidans]|uniref:Integral membrane protein n=1 Tax=Streptomyces antioxidans TaxID=1507734 RepID=A0A1V4D588_9ACTN|nr:hypothetical protein [Streptomyces antioxidans]OPF79240.1 hypothetical protein VT50_0216235 [Streptomyces antioxidans]